MARPTVSRADVLGIGLAVAAGLPTLAFPFGHDQGVNFYVAREWLLRGALPYRDAFDYKPPGIFVIHASMIALFGERQWPIRLAELACVIALGFIAWTFSSPPRPRGGLGVACCAASLLYFGFFNFWDTAQCEIWASTLALGGLAVVHHRATPRACAMAGLLSGLALLMKTPIGAFVLVTLFVVARRPETTRRGVALFLAGALAAPAACVVYFAARGGLADLYEALVRATGAYVVEARRVDSILALLRECVALHRAFDPFATIALVVVGERILEGALRGQWDRAKRYALPAALTAAGFIAVAAQMKFYHYHGAILVAPAVLIVVTLFDDVTRALDSTTRARFVPGAFIAGIAAAFLLSGPPAWAWLDTAEGTIGYAFGVVNEEQLSAHFEIPGLYFNARDSARAAAWLREHSRPEDQVLVRGFEAEIYALAERRAPGRFFWTLPFTDPARSYRRAEWTREDRDVIARTLPRFVVALSAFHEGPDSVEYFAPFGYTRRIDFGRLAILERPSELDRGALSHADLRDPRFTSAAGEAPNR